MNQPSDESTHEEILNEDAPELERGLRWFELLSLNRVLFILLALVGFLAILQSIRSAWFGVPVAADQLSGPSGEVMDSAPGCTVWFQSAVAITCICLGASWFWKRHWTTASTVIACVACMLPLSYPFFVVVRSPEVSADAAWLQLQHDNLTWLGGDIYANAEFGSKAWKSKTYLVDSPSQLAVVNLPSWSPWEFGLHRCRDLLSWLGYSNAFCQFVKSGWGLAVFGGVILLLSTLQQRGELKYHRAGAAILIFVISATALAIVAWSFPFRASQHVRRAAEDCSRQDFQASRAELEKAVQLLPVLGQDTNYIAQLGVLDLQQNNDSEYARLRTAELLEGKGCFDQAFAILRMLAESENRAIQREALRAITRFAIQDYNSARFELSYERFSLVLSYHPCDVKLIYMLQLQGIREGRLQLVTAMRDQMYLACERMNFGTRKVLRAAAERHCAIATALTEDAAAVWAAQSRAKRP